MIIHSISQTEKKAVVCLSSEEIVEICNALHENFNDEHQGEKQMKIKEIIDKVSELYRESSSKFVEINYELRQISQKISEADYNDGENITLAEYNRLKEKQRSLERESDMRQCYRDGISEVREMLLNLAYDIEVEK